MTIQEKYFEVRCCDCDKLLEESKVEPIGVFMRCDGCTGDTPDKPKRVDPSDSFWHNGSDT